MVKRALAWAGGLVLLALVVASVPLTRAAHQSSTASDVSLLVAFATFGGVGVVVAVRQPRNVMGWILIGIPVGLVLNTDMSAYAAIDYRVHPGRLPLGPLAVQLQPSWAPAVVLLGLAILLFPDATLPSIWWRRSVIAADQTYGWIIIRNTSATDCQLVGHIGLVGLGSTGTPDTASVSAPVAGGLLLTAHAAPVPENKVPPPGEHVAFLVPDSSLSTTIGPNPGADCTPTDQVTPSTFRLGINGSGTVLVANTADGEPQQFRQLRVCQGQITAGTLTGEPN
jgi:hypothetical protein